MAKRKVGLYVDQETYQALELLAEKEVRSVPNVIESFVVEGLRSKGLVKKAKLDEMQESSQPIEEEKK